MPIGGTGRDKENENAYESPKATRPGNSPPKSRPATPQSRGLRQRFSMLGPSVTSKPGASDGAPPNTSAPSAASGQRGSSKDSGASGSEEGGVLSKLSTAAVGAFSSTCAAPLSTRVACRPLALPPHPAAVAGPAPRRRETRGATPVL